MVPSPRCSLQSHEASKSASRRYTLRPRPAPKQTIFHTGAIPQISKTNVLRFFCLPLEIRQMIYILVINSSPQPTKIFLGDPIPPVTPIAHRALVLACTQTHTEFRQLFFNTGTYLLTIPRHGKGISGRPSPPHILGSACRRSRLRIQSLRIHFETWITNGKFEHILSSVLSDMVLYGDLHNLELVFAHGAGIIDESWSELWSACETLRLVNGVLRNVIVKILRENNSNLRR